jgi:16S rRNA (cytosine1402-N4)-methyltransferase
MEFHESVLLRESIDGLSIQPGGTYVDATYGGGGHSREILKKLSANGHLFAFDQDEDALGNFTEDARLTMIHNNFRYLRNFLRFYKVKKADGILADLGISSHQIDLPERGFSTRYDGALDMRMDRRRSISAREVINEYDEQKLTRIFSEYGEIRNSARLANTIVTARKSGRIETTLALKELMAPLAGRGKENKFFAQAFQALRIEVNEELEALKDFLKQGTEILNTGGRFVVISYHSLEDRLVKNFFRSGNFEGSIAKDFYGNTLVPLRLITRKPVVPTEEETRKNSRARSARLRIAEKI